MREEEIKDMIKEIVCTILRTQLERSDEINLFYYIGALDAVYVVNELEKRTGQILSGKFQDQSNIMTVNGLVGLLL